MKRGALKGVLADFCPSCKSFWLDKGELERMRSGKGKDSYEIKKEAHKEKKYEPVVGVKGACPRCFAKLSRYSEGSAKLDKCTRCEGMFFDRGELDTCLKEKQTSFLQRIIGMFDGG